MAVVGVLPARFARRPVVVVKAVAVVLSRKMLGKSDFRTSISKLPKKFQYLHGKPAHWQRGDEACLGDPQQMSLEEGIDAEEFGVEDYI